MLSQSPDTRSTLYYVPGIAFMTRCSLPSSVGDSRERLWTSFKNGLRTTFLLAQVNEQVHDDVGACGETKMHKSVPWYLVTLIACKPRTDRHLDHLDHLR